MNCNFLIVPDYSQLHKSAVIAQKYNAAFEYDDFFLPGVYDNPEEIENRIKAYLSLGRDTSGDTLHGVFFDIAPNSSDPIIAERSLNLMKKSFTAADRLGCRGVVFHSGIISGLSLPSYKQGWLDSMEKIYRELCLLNPRLELYLENSTEQGPELLVKMAERMADVPNFRLCLDYAHAALTPTPLKEWAKKMAPYIGHIHLNDNDGISDLHQIPGEGSLDFSLFSYLHSCFFPEVPVLLEVTGANAAEAALDYFKNLSPEVPSEINDEGIILSPETLLDVLNTTLAISRSKDKTAILNLILTKSMEIACCDAGTLYVLKDDGLHFKIMKTISMGIDVGGKNEPISLPPVELKLSNVCAYSALKRKICNITNVYDNNSFDFSGPKKYDSMTGYHTESMLTVPLMDENDSVLGVMQLLNAQSKNGELCSFDKSLEKIIEILAAQAAITLKQVNYIEEIRTMLWSFTDALAKMIDQRTPYNGSHTRNVAKYTGMIADYINAQHAEGKDPELFDDKRKDQLIMSAMLHDIGKMIIPLEVMNKSTRLGSLGKSLFDRFEIFRLRLKISLAESAITYNKYKEQLENLNLAEEIAKELNIASFLDDELEKKAVKITELSIDFGEVVLPLFTEEEKRRLLVKKGNLTSEERSIMEGHAAATRTILEEISFSEDYAKTPFFAAAHHEMLNGTGYPLGLCGDEIPTESRILAAADICDALIASDRPYKKALPREKAFAILRSMVKDGSLDNRIVEYLISSLSTENKEEIQ